jgi:hypothetical protein
MKIEELNNDIKENSDYDEKQFRMDDEHFQHKQKNGGGNNLNKKRKKQPEWEQLQKSEKLLKKFKKGKISKTELDEEIDETLD